jgi:hypothetical protein
VAVIYCQIYLFSAKKQIKKPSQRLFVKALIF